ncbi:hypothetical protein [Kitasatospora sp. NPDC001527]|uniref:hypothetical protein n=1 Tax=Kitasatospora sp. NPDC001527 TaxID=3154519 RepID=UPI0033199624
MPTVVTRVAMVRWSSAYLVARLMARSAMPWTACWSDVLAASAGRSGGGHRRAQLGLHPAGDGVDVAVVGEVGAGGEGQVHALPHHGADGPYGPARPAQPTRPLGAEVLARQRPARRLGPCFPLGARHRVLVQVGVDRSTPLGGVGSVRKLGIRFMDRGSASGAAVVELLRSRPSGLPERPWPRWG